MGYEVDLLAVASGGGALCVRWGVPGNYKVLVYDGGTVETGERLVAHIETHYQTTTVDHVVSSHPARDHLAGLGVVLRRLKVGELWMHQPWTHVPALGEKMRSALRLDELARQHGVPVHEPFEGSRIGPFTVLSPHERHYVNVLLPAFAAPPRRAARAGPGDPDTFFRTMKEWAGSAWRFEALPHEGVTGARNDSSAVLYGDFDGRGVLLTGSAGIPALSAAALCAERMGIHLPSGLRFLQVPNRGRRGNVSTQVLDRIVGVRMPADERQYTKTAFVSIGRDSPQGVERIVADALARRGMMTFTARDTNLHHAHGMPARGWNPARPSHRKKD
jgi:beta-lactamase superfamily II metal-dependent hydrolase